MDKVILGREVYDQIMYYVNKTSFEISGLGAVEIIDGIPVVTKIYLLDQENSSAETEMDGEAITKLMYEHHISKHPGELKFWWHSHVNMEVFWSGTDMKTIGELTENGWFIHGVFNKKYDYKLAYTTNDPCPIMVDDIELEINEDMVSPKVLDIMEMLNAETEKLEAAYDKEFNEKVTIKIYAPSTKPAAGTSDYYPKHEGATVYTPEWSRGIKQNEYNTYSATPTGSFTEAGYVELCQAGYTDDDIRNFNMQGVYCLEELDEITMENWGSHL